MAETKIFFKEPKKNILSLDDAGRIVIPENIMLQLGINKGDDVEMNLYNNSRLIVSKVKKTV